MERYNVYKDSRIEWLGEIPVEWELKRAKDISSITRGAILRPVDDPRYFDINGEWLYLNISDIKNCNMYLSNAKLVLSKLGSTKSARVKPNSLILTASATIGKPFINKVKVCVHDGFIPFMNNKVENRFLFYYLKNPNIYSSMGKSNTQKNIYLDEVKNIAIAFPNNQEQTQIANYLDAKTNSIDKKIKLLQQKIKHYKAYRRTLIYDTVAKGLDKTVKLKDSGIDWIGEIPEHWEVKRLKEISKELGSGATPLTSNPENYKNGSLYWVNTGDLNDSIVINSKRKISKTALLNYPNLKTYKKGTLIIAMYGATIGKLGVLGIDATTNQACCCINLKKHYSIKFIFYWLLSNKQNIISLSAGGTQPNISQSIIGKLKISLPQKKEQDLIADFLDVKTATIDNIVSNIETQITTLKELRKTLINEVVTGKVKVAT